MIVKFSELVEKASAQTATNYTIDKGVTVVSAIMMADSQYVALKTSRLSQATLYTLSFSGVRDRAKAPNVGSGTATFEYSPFVPVLHYSLLTGAFTSVAALDGATPKQSGVASNFTIDNTCFPDINFGVKFTGQITVLKL